MKKVINILVVLFLSITLYNCSNADASKPSSIGVLVSPSNSIDAGKVESRKVMYLKQYLSVLQSGGISYDWTDNSRCNVGLLAQVITGKTGKEVKRYRYNCSYNEYDSTIKKGDDCGSWSRLINYYCGVTNRPMAGIVGDLQKAGFTNAEICSLEYLSNDKILEKIGMNKGNIHREDISHLISYLQAWIEIESAK